MNENDIIIESNSSENADKIISSNESLPNLPKSTLTPTKIPKTSIPITPIPDFTIEFTSPDEQNSSRNTPEKYIDSVYEKLKIHNLKEDILQNVRNNIRVICDKELSAFKCKCEDLIEKSITRYDRQILHLQDELKSKDKIINQLLTTLGNITNTELTSKENIINKLICQNNMEKVENKTLINEYFTKRRYNDLEKSESINAVKDHIEKAKGARSKNDCNDKQKQNTPPKNDEEKSGKKVHIEIVGDSMLNGIQERGLNKDSNVKIKLRKYPGASSMDLLDHIKPSLRREPDQIILHAGTNDISNDINYLKNVKKIVKMVRETSKNTKLCFSSIICRKDVKKIDEKIETMNAHLRNYCKQHDLGFIDNDNIKKSDLNPKGLHLQERGSSKLAKNLLEFIY